MKSDSGIDDEECMKVLAEASLQIDKVVCWKCLQYWKIC